MLGTLFLWAGLSGGTVDPLLAQHLTTLDPDDSVAVIVYLEERHDPLAMRRTTAGLPRAERADVVRGTLQAHALRTQRELSRTLAVRREEDARSLERDRTLWIVNARAVTCSADMVEELASADGVSHVVWDPPADLEDAAPAPPPLPASGGASSRATPNIVGHQATALWNLGIDGRGVLILNIDSGVARDHPALAPSIWSNPGEIPSNGVDDDGNGFVDDTWGWDFERDDNNPYDGGHGTYTAGILVGNGAGNGGTATGMAPGATMAVAKVATQGQLLEAYQYAITIGADCISSSHSVKWGTRPDYHAFRAAMEMELAAGIIHANSIGNRGQQLVTDPVPWNISTPGNCPGPWVHPQQLSGGRTSIQAVGGILLGSDMRYPFGGQGPSAWEDILAHDPNYVYPQDPAAWDYPWWNGASAGLLKPDIAAYTNVRTTKGAGSYIASFGGTSAATPHVGGAFCLLLQQNPNALPRQLAQAIQETAYDLDDPGKDVRTGAGKLQTYEAALRIRSLVTLLPDDPAPGEAFDIVTSGPAGTPYLLVIGGDKGSFPVPFGSDLEIADPSLLWTGTHTGQGVPTVVTVGIPPNAALSGLTVHFQTLTDETSGPTGTWLLSLLETLTIR